MARIKIDIPEKIIATFHIPVRIADINYGNHVGNDAFVSIIHEARMQWLQQYGYTELNIEGTGLIMSDLTVEFKNESFYGDVVEVKLGAKSPTCALSRARATGAIQLISPWLLSASSMPKIVMLRSKPCASAYVTVAPKNT